jgi:hypothetical protein
VSKNISLGPIHIQFYIEVIKEKLKQFHQQNQQSPRIIRHKNKAYECQNQDLGQAQENGG